MVLGGAAALATAGSDELWEVTTKTEMVGMPFAMPAQTSRFCIPAGEENNPDAILPKDEEQECAMGDVRVDGNKTTWKVECTGEEPMTGSGEIEHSDGSYTGTMRLQGSSDGQPINLIMTYGGKRIGPCPDGQ